ncbi:hypothetical protein Agub_g6734 [Astrephomene gubernaculifera]|uniref:Uncharacterized protein n=1 Tax=Astrephomene gubernaculifera TaxID=47775 RepID=A0AAD3DNX7_9CHLO|nr:hypothetical protein Agub_g6734 [Astrephomene gubernaculifera]
MFRRLLGEIRERSSILSVTLPPQLFHDRLRHLPAMERLLSSSLVAPSLPGTASDKGANATAGNSSNCNDNSSSRQGGPYRLYFTPHQDPSTGDDAASGAEDCLLCLTGSRKHISLVAAWDRASAQDKGVKGILRREARQVKLRVHFDTTVTQEPVVPSHPHGSMQKKGKEPHRKEVQETNARLLLGCKVEVDEEDETAAAAVAVAPEASAVPERGMMDGAASSSGGTAAAGGQPGGGGGGGGECDGGGDCGKQQLEAAGAGKATSQGDALVASAADDEHKGAALVAAGAGDTNQGATAAAAVAAGGLPGADVAPASDAAGTGTRVEEALSAAAAAAAITAEAPAAHTHMLLDDNPVLLGCVDEAMQEAVSAATPVIVTTLPGQQGIGFSCHAGLAGHSRGGGAGGSAACRSMLTVVEAEGGAEGATTAGRMRMTWAIEYAAAAAAMPPRGAAGARVPAAVAADAASAGGAAALNASAAAGGAAVNAAGATAAGPEGGRGGDQEREEEEQEKEDALLLFRRRISASSDMSLVETEYPSDSSSDDSSSSDDTGVGAGRNGDSSIAAFDSYRSSLAGNLGMAAAGAEWGQHGFLPPRPSVAAGAGTLTGNLLNWCNSAVQQELTAGWCRPQGLAKWLTPKENDVPRPPAAAAAAAPAVAPAPQGSNLQPAAAVAAVCTTAAPAAEASSRQPNTCAPAVTAVADGRQLWSWRDLLPIYDIPRQQPLPPAGRNGGQTATAAPAVQHSAVAAANKTAAAAAAVGAPDAAVGSGSSAAREVAAAAAAAAHVGNAHTGSSGSGGSNRSGSVARVPQAGWSWGKVALPVLQAAVSQDLPSSCAPLCQELRVGLPQLWRDLKVLPRLPLRGCRLLLLASDPESAELQGPLQEAAEVLGLAWSRGHPDQPPEQLRSMQLLALGKSVEEGVAEMRGVILKSIAVHPIEIFSAPVLVHGLQLLAWEVRNRSAAATAGAGALSHGGMGSEAAAGAAGAATGAAAVELTLGRAMCLAAAAAATAVPRDCLPLYPHRVVVVVAAQGFMKTDPAVLDRLFGCMTAGAITWGEPWPLHMRAADIAAVLTRGSPQHRAAILRATTPGMCVPATGAASSRAVHSVAGKGAVMGAPLLSALSINAESTSQTELQVLSDANKFMCLMRPGRLVVAAYGEGQAERLGKPGRMCKNILCGTVREVVAFLELLLQDVSRC